MTCNKCQRLLLALPVNPPRDAKQHLSQCHRCAGYAERVGRLEQRLQAALRIEVPASVRPEL
jgi:predicted anti-sigma-YlaC factor YlaD